MSIGDMRMSSWSGRSVLIWFLLANAVYLAMVLYSIPKVMAFAQGLPLFDLSPAGYTHQEAVALLEALGEQGREAYVFPQLLLDAFYPALFALSYGSLMLWVAARGGLKQLVWRVLGYVPFLVCAFDYGENLSVWHMLTGFPDVSTGLTSTASGMTVIKSALATVYFVGLLAMLVLIGWRKLSGRGGRQAA
ncbi:hypothetical protein [Hydrogenophaga sp. 5NK40-0174]|uniref:hypothetical protein n=1 Tax=Hydrogenophaga sp. 5NK40-0174 TaxID=3127649 RepID=UPI00310757DF